MNILYEYRSDEVYYQHSVDPQPQIDRFDMRAHDRCEIYYFVSGKGSFIVEGSQYLLTPGTLLILSAGETHRPMIESGTPYERFLMQFTARSVEGMPNGRSLLEPFSNRRLGSGNLFTPDTINSPFIRECFLMIDRCAAFCGQEETALAALPPILTEVLRSSRDAGPADDEGFDTAQTVLAYINDNLTSQMSLDSLSEQFFMSKTQLSRIFRKATGTTVWEYILVKRLLLARQLIRTGVSASDACRRCGFGDYSCFYRAYKKRYGISPSDDK